MKQYTLTEEELRLLEWALVAMRPPNTPQESADALRTVEAVVRATKRRGEVEIR